ncbi:hypothetical protein [Planosporangium mesophilum]|uniref:Uncharacterized protein n=1 Tax=Planosporangium mesophilum TaxID=689768 RepID=A0A8J3X5B1_9ACTN|nr:hypothetical protein [Planosporangium mesophilum]NJC85546.1 hypothetical protein [Planosporangium mesophilum]GII24588.1 hypothetical protein Pme01_41850 [Planosporangium mesophilum]
MNRTVVGLDLDHDSVEAAEHWLHELVQRLGRPAGLVACTHLVYEPHPHVALSLSQPVEVDGGPHTAGARTAAARHEARSGGRAVYYPGVDALTGTLTVAEVIERSAVERVVMLGGAEAAPETVLHTLDYVRPTWTDGRLTLVTRPAPEGSLVPFELKYSTPCCADH